MKFAVIKNGSKYFRDKIADELLTTLIEKGNVLSDNINEVNFVLNLTDVENPKWFRRKSKSVFVISIVEGEYLNGTLRAVCYNTLIKSLSNLLVYVTPNDSENSFHIYFITPEAGFYDINYSAQALYEKILPIASSNFATENVFSKDLPEKYWYSTTVVEKIRHYGKVLDELGVLPTPFPLRKVLSERELSHLYKIFGITGASYGNLSAREKIPELGNSTFWMTGRGVDKSNINQIGKDVLLVKDFDFGSGTALLSVPPNYDLKARVSVDAVEHAMIYKIFPEVGAIIHVHAWMQNILCTRQNYPCGTVELATEVVKLLKHTNDPSRAVVGLKNHGLTITGQNFEEIFKRIDGKLHTEVEMF